MSCLILVLIDLPGNLTENQLFCIFERAGQEGAGGHRVASSAEFGGDYADIEGAPASQRASDSAVFELDEQRRDFD